MEILREEPLAKYTAARLGGPAERLMIARGAPEALINVVIEAWRSGDPLHILGGGANVLVSDHGARGLVIVNHARAPGDPRFDTDAARVTVGSGIALTVLARWSQTRGLAGFEWAASVPGTIGGAVVNNAGAHGGDMAGNMIRARILTDDGADRWWDREALAYAYRTSALKRRAADGGRCFVLEAELQLTPDDPAAIGARMAANIAHRKRTQPPGASLGSIFKNPVGDYAGRLIEACGLKGYAIGGAQISPVHANFFINTGGATARDYEALIRHARRVVAETTGVELVPEIERIGVFEE